MAGKGGPHVPLGLRRLRGAGAVHAAGGIVLDPAGRACRRPGGVRNSRRTRLRRIRSRSPARCPFPAYLVCPRSRTGARIAQIRYGPGSNLGSSSADPATALPTRRPPQRHDSVHGAPVGAHTLAEGQAGGADTSGDATIGLSDEFMMNRQLTRATSRPVRSPAAARTRPSCAPRDADRPAPGHRRRGRTPALGPPATAPRVPAVRRRLVICQELHRHRPQSRARPPPVPPTAIKPLQDPGPSGATHIGTASGVNAPVLSPLTPLAVPLLVKPRHRQPGP